MANSDEEFEDNFFHDCPICGSVWTWEEIDLQECDCCGYGIVDEDDEGMDWSDGMTMEDFIDLPFGNSKRDQRKNIASAIL